MGEFVKPVREVTIQCSELDCRVLVTLHPEGAQLSPGDVEVPGLSEPVRVWLRPTRLEEDAIRTFLRRCLTRDLRAKLPRSQAWRTWQRWLREDPRWHGVGITKGAFLKHMERHLGAPVKGNRASYVGWRMG